ncbi:MAG: flagellar filament capping protein FliD [Brevinema sp.]
MRKLLIFLIFTTINIHAQRVQLSSIPGQEGDMNVNDMLNQIMAPYYQELTNIQNRTRDKELELQLLRDFRTNVDAFDRINRYIFGYESSFRSLTNEVSDPAALQVQVDRTAKKGDYNLKIKQLAELDAFSSPQVSLDKVLPPGTFTVKVDDKSIPVAFAGGNIIGLADALQKTISNIVDVKIVNTSENTRTISLSTKKTGEKQKIIFEGDLAPLIAAEIISRGKREEQEILWPSKKKQYTLTNNSYGLDMKEKIKSNASLSFQVKMKDMPPDLVSNSNEQVALSNLQLERVGAFNIQEIGIPGAAPILEDFNKENTNTNDTLKQYITLKFTDNTEQQIAISNATFNIDLKKYADKCLLNIQAVSKDMISEFSSFLLASSPDGDLKPYNVISEAKDAVFDLDGVEVQRPENTISDLVLGVTLNLLQAESNKIVKLKIKPDIELVKDTVTQWVLTYNELMEDLHAFLTIPVEKVGRLKPLHRREEEGDDMKEGSFYGNSSLMSFRDRLRRAIGVPYGDDPNKISLLDQIGIYVRRANSTSTDPEAVKKGTLSLDMNQFESILNESFDDVFHIFVRDTDEDRVGDIGVTITMREIGNMMIGNTGYIVRTEQDSRRVMQDFNGQVSKKKDDIERIERRERRALLQMNQAVAASKAQNESLRQRFNN